MTRVAEPAAPDRRTVEQEAREPIPRVLRELRTGPGGLSSREATRRLQAYGPNSLPPSHHESLLHALGTQLGHPLALLLWGASVLALVAGMPELSVAIVAVILLNAVFALIQERHAQRSVEALAAYLPSACRVVRDGVTKSVEAATLVPGDVLLLDEGDRVPADARLLDGGVQVDMSALTGESASVDRVAGRHSADASLLALPDLVFSGTLCTSGSARAVVLATGARSEIGRIAALTRRVRQERSPLEEQVRRVAWLIAGVAVGIGIAFLPLGLLAGLSLSAAALFAIGLLVANVPEGLLPTITLALSAGVRVLARRNAVVKRLSAIETLGSTTVICTDKTGTLTLNRMRPAAVWTIDGGVEVLSDDAPSPRSAPDTLALSRALAGCSVVEQVDGVDTAADPTDLGLQGVATAFGVDGDPRARDARRRALFRFDADRRLSSTVQDEPDGVWAYVRGAPESVLARSTRVVDGGGTERALTEVDRRAVSTRIDSLTLDGLRVIGVARRRLGSLPPGRDAAEEGLTFLGLAALQDPPRPEVRQAVTDCHTAGIRINVVTGDNGNTAAHVARAVGLGVDGLEVVDAARLEAMSETDLDHLLAGRHEIVFARSAPEAKLRIADALRSEGNVVAMTGDGVNDAPALHRADIGVAMGRSGTEVAREAATMVLTDDNFATLVNAVRAGRQVYDNVRKFIVYIFAHAVPEVVPFLVFALSGGAVPLPLTVMQILAIDLGTETLPALALGREPAEPGIMTRRPRGRAESVITRAMLWRAWGFLGLISAALTMLGFFAVLWQAGWHPGADTDVGAPLHHAYVQATTIAWAGLVACQVGTALACRTDHASLRQVGLRSNPLLLWGIAFEIAFAALLIYTPGVQSVFDMTAPPAWALLLITPFPAIVWGADEWRRHLRRRREAGPAATPAAPTPAR